MFLAQWTNQKVPQAMPYPKPVPKASGAMDEPEDSPGYATSELLVQWTNQMIPQAMPHPKPVPKASGAMDEPEYSTGYATSETTSQSFWRNGRSRRFPIEAQAMPHP
jgi:hypothetical protein